MVNEWSLVEDSYVSAFRIVSSLGHNILNVSFLCSSIVLVIRLITMLKLRITEDPGFTTEEFVPGFLKGFLATAFVLGVIVMCIFHRSFKKAEYIEHESKLYFLCLFWGWVFSVLAWVISRSMESLGPHRRKVVCKFSRASFVICGAKTVWCLATLFWPSIKTTLSEPQYHQYLVAFIVERLCACLTLHQLKELAASLNQLPEP